MLSVVEEIKGLESSVTENMKFQAELETVEAKCVVRLAQLL